MGSYRTSPRDQASASSKIPIDRWAEHVAERIEHCEYIQRRENVIAVGNSTTGKAHVALGVGLAGCQRGISVCLTTAAALVHELMEAREERRLLSLQRQLSRLNLLIIDELGFVPLSRTGAELLFEVFSQRYERGSIMVTTNLPFDEWTEVSARNASPEPCWTGSPTTCTSWDALLDRLTQPRAEHPVRPSVQRKCHSVMPRWYQMSVVDAMRTCRVGGLSASRYLLTVARGSPTPVLFLGWTYPCASPSVLPASVPSWSA